MDAGCSQATEMGPNASTPHTPPADDMSPAVGRFKVDPKESFHVEFDLGRGGETQPIRMTIPKNESYDKFLRRLRSIFHGDSFERSLRRWEYTLVDRRFGKAEPLPLTSPNTYYAMISELLSTRSRWRHALIRRSDFENPIRRAVAEGTFHLTSASLSLSAAAIDTSLPRKIPIHDASQPDISAVNTPPVAEAFQPDVSTNDTPMPDAPMDEATPSSKAWVIKPASAKSSSGTLSPSPSFDIHARHRIAPSTPIARARPSSQSNSPVAPALRARYAPLISSPLKPSTCEGDRRSALLSSPRAPITIAPEPSQRKSPLVPVATAQSPIAPQSSPLTTNVSRRILRIKFKSTLPPSATAQRPAVSLNSSGPPVANFRGSSKELDSMSAAAATEQDPTNQNGSSDSPVLDAPSPSTKLCATSATSALTTNKRGVSQHPSSSPMQPGSPIAPFVSAQAAPAILPSIPDPSTLQDSGTTGKVKMRKRLLASAHEAPRPPANPQVESDDLFQRSLNLPPRPTSISTPKDSSTAKPTLIHLPRRPLRIIARQRLNQGTQYLVHWNHGRNSWETHDSLYRDYPAFVDRYLGEQH